MIFNIIREKLLDAVVEIKTLKYWRKIENKFRKACINKVKLFILDVKHSHNIFSTFQPDDEMRIEHYANKYGYRLISESLGSKKSTYKFELGRNLYNI